MKVSFNAFLKLHEVMQRVPVRRSLTCLQKAPGVQGKLESVLARLERFKAEPGSTVGDEDESKRRTVLFE